MKGQLFLIGAVVIIVGLFLLKNLFSVHGFIEEVRYLETSNPGFEIDNVMREYQRVAGLCKVNNNYNYLSDFSMNLRNNSYLKSLYFVGVANNTGYIVISGNFIGYNINVTIDPEKPTLSATSFVLPDVSEQVSHFSYSNDEIFIINISYEINGKIENERFHLKTGSDNLGSFFQVTFRDDNLDVSKKQTYEVRS